MKTITIKTVSDMQRLKQRLRKTAAFSPREQKKVRHIVDSVRSQGDKALLAFSRQFDGYQGSAAKMRISAAAIQAAYAQTSPAMLQAIKAAKKNITAYQKKMLRSSWASPMRKGVILGQQVRALSRIGICVPGGEAPLVSSVLMSAVPAKVADVAQVIMCTPNRMGRGLDPRLLVAADIAGVDEIYQVGGAQAVAAMAYGTRSISAVDKIVGPGSRWVTMAKKEVYGDVGIDSLAGPSESLVIADAGANAIQVAADVISQAEHAGDETAILVTPSVQLALKVQAQMKLQISASPRKSAIQASLKSHGLIILVKNMKDAVEVANACAVEHLQIVAKGAKALAAQIQSAGAIFIGEYTPVALGDFVAGPSHVLPTGRTARFSSGLSVDDFVKKSSTLQYSRAALAAEAKHVEAFAQVEGLQGHGDSVTLRLKSS